MALYKLVFNFNFKAEPRCLGSTQRLAHCDLHMLGLTSDLLSLLKRDDRAVRRSSIVLLTVYRT